MGEEVQTWLVERQGLYWRVLVGVGVELYQE